MDILNKNGQILLDYRSEYKRHYADSVDEALKSAVYTLYKEGRINERIFRMLFDETLDDLEIYTYLLTQKEFTKTSAELNYEFDKVRQKVNDYLISIGMIDNVSTKNSLSTNRITILKEYDVPKEVLLSFFGLTPTEIVPLMKRKGFMDKFCVLRLNQIFKEIYSELKVPDYIDHGYSLVYYNKEIQGFSIDYKYSININFLSDEAKMREALNRIKELDRTCEKKFQNKLNFAYFSAQPKKKDKKPDALPAAINPQPKPIQQVVPSEPKPNPKRENMKPVNEVVTPTKPPEESQETSKSKPIPEPKVEPETSPAPPKQPGEDKNRPQQKPKDKKKEQSPKPPQQEVKKQAPKEEKVVFVDVPQIEIDEDDKDLL